MYGIKILSIACICAYFSVPLHTQIIKIEYENNT